MNGMPCPNSETLRQALAGEPSACTLVGEHLEHCPDCAQRAGELDQRLPLVPTALPTMTKAYVQQLQGLWSAARHEVARAALQAAFGPAHGPDELGHIRHFRIVAHLASGGMGHVFRAEDTQLQRPVAIKMVTEPLLVELMQREWTVLAALRHPNIVTVYESGCLADRWPYFVMEYIAGTTLTQYLIAQNPSLRQRVLLLRTIAHAVGAAHTLHIIHRDLKPTNIMLTPTGDVRILDFGLAKRVHDRVPTTTYHATVVGSGLLGTHGYMSPEQAQGDAVEATSDVFALGVILRELVPAAPPAIQAISAKACADDPAERYADANAFAAELTRWLEDYPVLAYRSWWYRGRVFGKRHRWSLLLGVLLVTGTLAGFIADSIRVHRERDRTEAKRLEALQNYRRAKQAVQEYLLTITDDPDLMSEGRHELRAKLLDKARVFYEEFRATNTTDPDDPELRADAADALSRLASIASALGDKEKALQLYQEAAVQCDWLRHAQPQNDAYRWTCVEAFYNVAVVQTELGQFEAAHEALGNAVQRLGDDGSPEGRRKQARIHRHTGWLHQLQARYTEAAHEYEGVLVVWRELLQTEVSPALQKELAHTLLRLGTVKNHLRQRAEAKAHFEECRQLREALTRMAPKDTTNWRKLALTYERLARVALGERQFDAAQQWQTEAQTIYATLVRDYPAITSFRMYASENQRKYGTVLRQLGRLADAEPLLHASVQNCTQLYESQPKVIRWATNLGRALIELGQLRRAQERLQEALSMIVQGVILLEQVDAHTPGYSMASDVLPSAWSTIATLRDAQGDAVGADAARQAATAAKARRANKALPNTRDE